MSGLQADIGAVEMKTGQIGGKAKPGFPADDNEILVQGHDFGGKIADASINAMRVCYAYRQNVRGDPAGVSRQRPFGIDGVKSFQSAIENVAIVGNQPYVLMT